MLGAMYMYFTSKTLRNAMILKFTMILVLLLEKYPTHQKSVIISTFLVQQHDNV